MTEDTDAPASAEASERASALARAIREARGDLIQSEFARLIGRPQSVISMWENGKSVPGLEMLHGMEEALGLRYGTLALRAGYFTHPGAAGATTGPRLVRDVATVEDALQALQAAETLDLDVRIGRLSQPTADDGPRWVLELSLPESR